MVFVLKKIHKIGLHLVAALLMLVDTLMEKLLGYNLSAPFLAAYKKTRYQFFN